MFSRSPYRRIGLVAISAFTTCSHLQKATLSNANSQHTTFSLGRCWYQQGMPARQLEGRGQLFFPLHLPHPQKCGCQSRFRHDVHLCDCFTGRLRRCEPPPSRNVSSRVNVFSRDGLRNCFSGMPCCRGLPPAPHQLSIGGPRGPRPTAWNRWAIPVPPRGCMRWDGGGSHRLRRPGRVHLSPHNRGINTAVPRARCLVPQRCPRLDTAPSACWCQQE